MDDFEDVIREFLVESHENLDRLDQDLIVLEADPTSRQTLSSVFRTIHTIKGTCGFLGFSRLEAVTHAGENLLARLRDGRLTLTPEITSALLALVDAVREILAQVEATHAEGEGDYGQLIATLDRLQEPASAQPPPAPPRPARPVAVPPPAEEAPPATAEPAATPEPAAVPEPAAAPEPAAPPAAGPEPADHGATPAKVADDQHEEEPERHGGPRHGAASESTVRVDVALLDQLMDLVGELVLARNRLARLAGDDRGGELAAASQRLSLLTSELQDGVMKTRMQPIGNLWAKLPRVVRDLALACGKQVRIELTGGETELDRTILEAIKDPLTHLVRNAVDHGIEPQVARLAAGKPAEGVIALHAFYEGGQVQIELADDGGGIDLDRVRRRAVDHGVVGPDEAQRMSDREVLDLVFLPGFSTAEAVTSLSGRGVGMDVVRTNVERIGGIVEVDSRPGAGTTFRVQLPLTLAIVPALVVGCAGQRFAIPQVSVVELVRLEGGAGVELLGDRPVYRLRGRLLPLVFLHQELELAEPDAGHGAIVVLQAGEQRLGLVVDGVDDTEEIVVKPLGGAVKQVGLYAGATVMGDGTVALILDVPALARHAGVSAEARERAVGQVAGGPGGDVGVGDRLLVVTGPDGIRLALPLALVDRLEEFPRGAVELTGEGEVVQYQGGILPLVRIAGGGGRRPDGGTAPDRVPVVVVGAAGRRAGLVVDQIVDVVSEQPGHREPPTRAWSAGCTVLAGRVTELLDVEALLAGGLEERSGRPPDPAAARARAPEAAEV